MDIFERLYKLNVQMQGRSTSNNNQVLIIKLVTLKNELQNWKRFRKKTDFGNNQKQKGCQLF